MATTPPAEIPVARALRAFINELSARADVRVHERKYGYGMETKKELPAIRARFPPDMVALYEHMNGLTFIWDFADAYDPDSSPGLHGGRIVLRPLVSKWKFRRKDPGYSFPADTWFYGVDEHSNEGITYVVYREGEEPRRFEYVFGRAGEENEATFVASTFDGYLRKAIEHAFAWYWPQKSAESEATLARLRASPARLRPVLELSVKSWEPIDMRAFRLDRLRENAQYRKLGKVLKRMGEKVARTETPEELSERLVDRLAGLEGFDDATIAVLHDETSYGTATLWSGHFNKLPVEAQRRRLARYFCIGREEPLVRATITLKSLVPREVAERGLPGDFPSLLALLLSQAPGAQVERIVPHATLWDYISSGSRAEEILDVLVAPVKDAYVFHEQLPRGEPVPMTLTLRADLFPELHAGTTWTAGAVVD